MEKFISCRASEQQAAKLERLAKLAGLSKGAVLRALVDAADVQPVQTFRPVLKNKTAVHTLAGNGGLAATPIR